METSLILNKKKMINNLKKLYERVQDKKAFIKLLADEYHRTENSITTNWLSSWAIPEQHQARVHELLINTIWAETEKTKKLLRDELD